MRWKLSWRGDGSTDHGCFLSHAGAGGCVGSSHGGATVVLIRVFTLQLAGGCDGSSHGGAAVILIFISVEFVCNCIIQFTTLQLNGLDSIQFILLNTVN
jgi:hypothetical protein